MRIRKFAATLAAVSLSVVALAACGGGGDGSSSEPSASGEVVSGAPAPEGATKLSMWVFAELHAAVYDEMAIQWNEENPDKAIDLDITVYPYQDMHDKLLLAANAGTGMPDLVDIEVNKFSNFVKGDNPPLADLSAAAEPYIDDIVKARLDLYSRDGKIYGYPTHVGAFVAFYNQELLEAQGIDYTTIKTWDDFKEAGVKYHEATDKAFGTANTGVWFVEPLVTAQMGGQVFEDDGMGKVSVNNPEAVKALELMADMEKSGALSTIAGGSPDAEEAYGAINNGDYAAIVYPAWYTSRFVDYMPDLAGKIAIAPAPQIEGSETLTIGGGGTGTAVSASSENLELATEFNAFAKLSLPANVAVWEVLGFDPVNMSVWEDDAVTHNPENKFNKYFTTNLFDVLNSVKDGIGHFNSFANPNLPAVDNWFRTVTLNEVYENDTPVKEALDQAQTDLENEIGE
ncbi:extracellular solute-binding protein [Tessaracoccus sp. MC1865]|uniref:ABC transporter substrate-binding protein n=1 Tax=Tessaracoccus sp. MC1865 TaxID=2760310 RepID=UPI0016019C5F|nr:extracellular solute-binding protein [Tessaracoccus sp. MC1865]MBB1483016.1 extracellular solute-binding protein [Tessaracoccus sp. MC1865]QTO37550.1 extracellular solute-binding protein [Tessaracoccus sp. MC1865]